VLPDPPWPPSLGCAAGPTLDHAALRALEELIERDALALWWRGGRRGLAIPLESPAASRAASMIGRLRRDRSDRRRSWLLDITTENGVPVVAALSCAPDGFGVCGGFAARANGLADAAVAAVLELAQMELAYALAAAKARERGEAALNPQDRAHLRRHVGIDAGRAVLLHPALPPGPRPPTLPPPASEAATPAEALSALVRRLEALGQAPLRLDLTRPEVCVPVVRMLSPGLEKESGSGMGARLRRAIAENGAGWTPDLAFA
jgi:ribosomal protein S12 methylthiotransferase accessory factor